MEVFLVKRRFTWIFAVLTLIGLLGVPILMNQPAGRFPVSPCAFDLDEQFVPALLEVHNSPEFARIKIAVTLMLAEDQFVVHPDLFLPNGDRLSHF